MNVSPNLGSPITRNYGEQGVSTQKYPKKLISNFFNPRKYSHNQNKTIYRNTRKSQISSRDNSSTKNSILLSQRQKNQNQFFSDYHKLEMLQKGKKLQIQNPQFDMQSYLKQSVHIKPKINSSQFDTTNDSKFMHWRNSLNSTLKSIKKNNLGNKVENECFMTTAKFFPMANKYANKRLSLIHI